MWTHMQALPSFHILTFIWYTAILLISGLLRLFTYLVYQMTELCRGVGVPGFRLLVR